MLPDLPNLSLQLDDDGVGRLTVKREDARNALSRALVDAIARALDAFEAEGTRVLIVTGAGDKAFVGGADIAELKQRNKLDALRQINASLFRKLERFPRRPSPPSTATRSAAASS